MIARRNKADAPRIARKDRSGVSPVAVGALVLIVALCGVYLGFTKHIPFTHGYRVQAVFESANSIRTNAPVRIAGVNVGKVKNVERQPGTTAAIVEMEIDKKGLPIHKDATMKIRPRIFLEGNFFVDLQPGTPSAPVLSDEDTIPITQTATPVQLDQVLTSLQQDTREGLKATLDGYGTALTAKATALEDAAQDPSTRGQTAAQSLNDTIRTGADSLKNTAIVNHAALGLRTHDLSNLVKGLGTVTKALDTREPQLQGLITRFNTTMAALASESAPLRSSIHQLGPTLQTANTTLTSLNAAFPNTRAFAREILPGVRETPATIKAAFPFIRQTRGLLQQSELRGLAQDLRPTVANASKLVDRSLTLLPQTDLISQCATKVVLPTGDVKIDDGTLSVPVENYKEFWYTMVGLAGEGQNFDGNGMYVRFQVGGGDQTVSTGEVGGALGDTLFGKAASKPLGTRPAFPLKRPPYVSDVPCKDQKIPDLNAAKAGGPDGGGAARAGTSSRSATSRKTAAAGAAKGQGASDSLGAQILSRLNPLRGAGPGGRP